MKFKQLLVLILIVVSISAYSQSQAWSGLLNSTRAVNWQRANVGVPGGIPTNYTQCGSTIAAYGTASSPQTATQINSAVAACGANQYVLLGPGTFYLSSSIDLRGKSNLILRGSGPTQTILNFTNVLGNWSSVGGAFSGSIYAGTTSQNSSDTICCQPGGSNAGTWTGGFAQGATSITLSNLGSTGIVNGDIIVLDQQGDVTDTNGYVECAQATSPLVCMAQNQVEGRTINGVAWSQEQFVKVTSGCATTCTGTGPFTIGISPGLYANNWNQGNGAGQTGVWWTKPVTNVGVENLAIDDTNCPDDISCNSGLVFFNVAGGWAKNLIISNTRRNHIHLVNGYRMEVRDSYFYGTKNGESQSYGVEFFPANDSLVENNIFQQIAAPIMFGGGAGSVIGYNFSIDNVYGPSTYSQGSYFSHSAGNYLNLFEGNVFNDIMTDQLHGTGGLFTAFRNWLNGLDWNTCAYAAPGCSSTNNYANHPSIQTQPLQLASYTRGVNIVGNVLGTPGYHTNYQWITPTNPSSTAACNAVVYLLGYSAGPPSCNIGGTGGVADDPLVAPTLMRWGNYDTANGAVQWNTTEAQPAAVTYISANTLANPSDHTLPASFYLASKPSFFGSTPYPAIGPDVTGGNGGFFPSGTYARGICPVGLSSGGATCASNIGGHANTIPAMACYFNVLSGPSDGSGGVLSFDANTCYGTPPAAPTSLTVLVQ